jgi:integrase
MAPKAKKRTSGEGTIFPLPNGGHGVRVYLGPGRYKEARSKFWTRTQAAQHKRELERQRDAGLNMRAARQTLAAFLQHWLDDVKAPEVRPTTLVAYRMRVQLITQHLGGVTLARLTTEQVQHVWGDLYRAGYAPASIRLTRTVLIMALGVAEEWGLIARNVARKTKAPRVAPTAGTPLTVSQAHALLRAADEVGIGDILRIGLYLGLRRGEILGLRWQDIDTARGVLQVQHNLQRIHGTLMLVEPKTRASVGSVPLPATIITALHRQRAHQAQQRLLAGTQWQDHDLVFTTEQGKPMPPERVSKQFALARSAAGLAVRFHDLRHSTATLLGALRDAHGTPIVPPKVAQRILRHGRIETTLAVYTHVTDTDQLSAAMHAFDAALDQKVG